MKLIKITELSTHLGLSSRTLRYYEQVGLVSSVRESGDKFRYYDAKNVERLKQIMVLRKMQIPIKDILRIYESEDMRVVVQTFVSRIRAIDDEVDALTELRALVNDFLHAMMQHGVTKISALPILYEKMNKRLDHLDQHADMNYERLSTLSDRLTKPVDASIIRLKPMRVLSSIPKENRSASDPDSFSIWMQKHGVNPGEPGSHEQFEYETDAGTVVILKITDDFIKDTPYMEDRFPGGLFAATNAYLDEDLGQRFRAFIKGFDENKYYQIDYADDGGLRHPAMLETLTSPDDQRALVLLLVPVKKRLPDPALYGKPTERTDRSIAEIEAANTVLWTMDVKLDQMTPINNPHYRMTESGEVEYIGWVLTRVLNTNVAVKLPFRVDIEFRVGDDGRFGYGATENSIHLYHGDHGLDHNYPFTVKTSWGTGTSPAEDVIRFHQPMFRDVYHVPKGESIIRMDEYNQLTWIIGETYLACIINGAVRYCGEHFPYMAQDLSREEARPIIIGSDRKKYLRSIRVTQYVQSPKKKRREGELTMITKRSNHIIPVIHRLVTDEYGENYWFNGCAKYVMECLGEKDYDYWFFAGLTGDLFTQHYTYTRYAGDALSSYRMDESMGGNPAQFVEDIFGKCGYAATYVSNREARRNTEMYINTLIAYIDKGIPVIAWGGAPANLLGVFVGYEEYGKVLLYITGNNNQPERIPLEKALRGEGADIGGWIFVGEKKEDRSLAEIYRAAIGEIPRHLAFKTDAYCFGAAAFRAWAADIENGKFDAMTTADFDAWSHHTNYVCVLATNGSCCHGFLEKAQALNPDMGFLAEVSRLYKRTAEMWNNDNGADLEALGGGFNVTLEVLQDQEKRGKIAAKLRACADVTDEIARLLNENL